LDLGGKSWRERLTQFKGTLWVCAAFIHPFNRKDQQKRTGELSL
jgi:hypothetical protein